MSGVHLPFHFTFRMAGATLRPMKHRLVLLIVSLVVAIVGVGVGLVVLVWVLRRVLDANSKVVDELAGALKRATGGGVGVELDSEGVPHVIHPDGSPGIVTPYTTADLLTGAAASDLAMPDDDAIRAAAAEVQAIANQLAEPATYLDHTDEFVPEEVDALFGPPPTIPAQNFIQDFSDQHAWPDPQVSF